MRLKESYKSIAGNNFELRIDHESHETVCSTIPYRISTSMHVIPSIDLH